MPRALSIKHVCPVRRVGRGDKHHFFGYYNKHPWDRTGRYLLANQVSNKTGDVTRGELAQVGFFDLEDGDSFHVLGKTTTWNWQMGCQLQWLGGQRRVIFNTRAQGRSGPEHVFPDFRSTVVDIETGERRELPMPIYVLAPDGSFALTVNYSRFMVTHRTIGYPATSQEPELRLAPSDDGIFRIDIESSTSELILSLEDLRHFQPVPSMDNAIHWVTHVEVNASGTRFLFIHRWTERVEDETCFLHRLFTVNCDGTDLRLLECSDHPLPQLSNNFDPNAVGVFDYEKSKYQISHPMWKSDHEIIVWGPHKGAIHYHLYEDRTGEAVVIGRDCLTENGHMTYSPDGRWILSDTYPDDKTNKRLLILYDVEIDQRYDIGEFFASPNLGKHNRCDLHPRWNPDGRQVCIDSVHDGMRQIYILDVSSVINV